MPPGILTSVLMLIAASAMWAGNSVVARAVHQDIEPFTLTVLRWALATVLLLPFTWRHVWRDWPTIAVSWKPLCALATLSVSVYTSAVYIAAHTTDAINISLVGSVTPAAAVLMSWLLIRERVTWLQSLGFLIGLAGVVAVIARGEVGNLMGLQVRAGDLVVLVGVFSWAVYSVLLKRHPLALHPMSLLSVMFVIGTLAIVPFFAWEAATSGGVHVNGPGLAAILYGAVGTSILCYFFFIRGVQVLGPNRANAFGYLSPLFAGLLAVAFLGEPIRIYHLAGFVLICSGVYLTTIGRRSTVAS